MISTKTCSKCKIEQPLDNFHRNKRLKDGHCSWCKECSREKQRKHYSRNKEKIRAKHKEYEMKNKEKIKKIQAEWYIKNREAQQEEHRRYYREHREERRAYGREYNSRPEVKTHRAQYAKENREHIRAVTRKWRDCNREECRKRNREYYHRNKDKVKVWRKRYEEKHREELRSRSREYAKNNRDKINNRTLERLHNDPVFKMKEQTRNMLRYVFRSKGHKKSSKTAELLGCDLDFFCEYMFQTWEENYGKPWDGEPYHIDHIVPLATAKTKEDIVRLCHYTNLQMLTPEDNMTKGNKI